MAPQDAPTEIRTVRSERRQLTVMFCDLVGSTEMSTQMDPEDMRDLLVRYRDICAREVQAFGGYVAQYLGDGILAYFGYPQAHENDVANSLRAGRAIVAGLAKVKDARMNVRIGVATGTVVVGDVIAQHTEERDIAIGQTPNLAARMMGLCKPGEIVVADSTQKLAPDLFDYEELPNNNLKGFEGSTTAWKVTGATQTHTRSQVVQSRSYSTPLVGRRDEIAQIENLWRKAQAGQGQAVLITGEAGIGKSRLAHHFLAGELAERDNAPVLEKLYCSDLSRNSPLRPVADHILTGAKTTSQASDAEQARNIDRFLGEAIGASQEQATLLREVLSLTRDDPSPSDQSGDERKRQAFELLESYLCRTASNGPAILMIEDLHWCDSMTLELLEGMLLERIADIPLLVILSARPEFLPNWPTAAHVSSIAIGRLTKAEATLFLDQMKVAAPLSDDVRRQVIERSDAIPLFLEEVCKATSESLSQSPAKRVRRIRGGDGAVRGAQTGVDVPTSLASSLTARLDRLGAAKEVAQVASVIGQNFSFSALHHLNPIPENALEAALVKLIEADVIVPRQKTAEPFYVFKHALIQDAAYSSILRKERKRLHARFAVVLEEDLAGSSESQPELIARHYANGGLPEDAIENWRLAGERARGRSANSDAIAHFTNGLELLDELPGDDVTDEIEIDLRTNLALALTAVHGAGFRKVGYNYSKARSLSAYKADSAEHFPVMVGVWSNSFMSGDLNEAYSVTEEILRIADRKNEVSYAVEANRVRGMTQFYRGDFQGAIEHISQTVALHDPELHEQHALRFGLDPLVCGHAYLSYAHLFLGQADAAVAASERAIAEAHRIDHLYSRAFSLAFAAFLQVGLERPAEASRLAQATIECAQESEIQFFATQQYVVEAWARTMTDPGAVGEMAERVDAFLESNSSIGATRVMSMMAEMNIHNGRPSDAKALLANALERASEMGEAYYLAEIHRLQAELVWATDGRDCAEAICAHLTTAVDIAEAQHAAIWIRRNAQCAHRLHGLIAGKNAPPSGTDQDLESFTDDKAQLAERIAYSRHLIDLIGTAAAA